MVAGAPNKAWSWDIIRWLRPEKWSYFYPYVTLKISGAPSRAEWWRSGKPCAWWGI